MKYNLLPIVIKRLFYKEFKRQIIKRYGKEETVTIIKKFNKLYKDIVLRAPYIGGMKNPLTLNIIITVYVIAIYKSIGDKITPNDMGDLFRDIMVNNRLFRFFMQAKGKKSFTSRWQKKRSQLAEESQKRRYQGDWVSEFVYGDTSQSYGINFYECGICKLLKRENAFELAPYMCEFDFTMAEIMGADLKRTKTIANGDSVCDFKYYKL